MLFIQCLCLAALVRASPLENLPPSGQYLQVDNRPIYVETHGQGPPLVFLHGGAGTINHSFSAQIPYFSNHFRIIAVEQIGHGHTPDANIPYSYRQMAEDTAQVLQQLGVSHANLVGWSDGGNVALLLAAFYPGLVNKVVVSGANAQLVGLTASDILRRAHFTPEEAAQDLGVTPKHFYLATSPDGEHHWPSVAKKIQDLWLTPVVITPKELATIKAPVLVVAGEQDIIPIQHTFELAAALHQGQVFIVPKTGHDTFNLAADVMNATIEAFLAPSAKTPLLSWVSFQPVQP